MPCFWLPLLLLAVLADDVPVRIGLIQRPAPGDAAADAYRTAVAEALADWNSRTDAAPKVDLVVEDAADDAGLRKAMERLGQAGARVTIGPLWGDPAVVHAAARSVRMPLLTPEVAVDDLAEAMVSLLAGRLRLRSVGLVADRDPAAKALAKGLRERLHHPAALTIQLDATADAKTLARRLAREPAQVLILDAEPRIAAAALRGALLSRSEPIVLTPRACGTGILGLEREVFAVLYRSPATLPEGAEFTARWTERHGTSVPFGAAEGHDLVNLALRVVTWGKDGDAADLHQATSVVQVTGPRGIVRARDGSLAAPLALWRLVHGAPRAYIPPVLDPAASKGTAALREPDPELGVAFGARRTDAFVLAEDTQWVLFTYGEGEERTVDRDLAVLGLSTGGVVPLLDHLIREELMARLIAICASKFLRNEDGTVRLGESLAISFSTHLPPKAKPGKAWRTLVGGDHEYTGGQAWPGQGHCVVYSTFLRRTIYEPHALDPPVGPDDLKYLDGAYRFGTDPKLDKRAELIRALINGYAGGMALTAAHEIGHLCGLDHCEADAAAIMNVNEGAGVDHRDGHFLEEEFEHMRKLLGVIPKDGERR